MMMMTWKSCHKICTYIHTACMRCVKRITRKRKSTVTRARSLPLTIFPCTMSSMTTIYWKHERNYRTLYWKCNQIADTHTFDNWWHIDNFICLMAHTKEEEEEEKSRCIPIWYLAFVFFPCVCVWWHLSANGPWQIVCTHRYTSHWCIVWIFIRKKKRLMGDSIGQFNKRPN